MLQVSRRVEYALRASIVLAGRVPGERLSYRAIAALEGIPEEFLAKILRALVDAGVATSTRGPNGGFALAREPATISFLDVIEAVDGPVALNACCDRGVGCDRVSSCVMDHVWRKAEHAMLQVFRQTTLADVSTAPSLTAWAGA